MNFDKTKTTTIALILMLTFSATILALPMVSAHDPAWSLSTATYISAAPDTVGANQQVVLMFMLHMPPPTAGGAFGDRYTFYIEITKPDGSTETQGPITSDPVGGGYLLYTPDQVGTYYFQASYPGQTITNENPDPITPSTSVYIGDYFEPSTSTKVAVTVQQDPIPGYQEAPHPGPNQYWDRPISALNREWWQIASNWLMDGHPFRTVSSQPGGFQPYGSAPNSPHIVWTRELTFGGVVGGELGNDQYYTGMSYEMKFDTAVIINGVLYYHKYPNWAAHARHVPNFPGVYAVDLRTGEEIWYNPDMRLSFGQLFAFHTGNEHGVKPYLWESSGSTYKVYDAFTGDWMYTIENATGGTTVFGKDGSILNYRLTADQLTLWNSSAITALLGAETGTLAWQWRPYGKTVDGRDGIEWTVDVPKVPGQGIRYISDGVVVATVFDDKTTYPYPMTHVGYDATTGERLWIKEHPWHSYSVRYGPAMDGVYTMFTHKDLTFKGYDISSGAELWESEPFDSGFDLYSRNFVAAYGRLYITSMSGRIYCLDIKTGERLWTFYAGSAGYETPYGHYPFLTDLTAADGKIFAINGEHSENTPLYKGYKVYAIDAYTGEALWDIAGNTGHYRCMPVADGYLLSPNIYDNRIYCFGKGPSKTTVTAPDMSVQLGSSVMIRGTVTDESGGTKQDGLVARFPNGVPAISDEDMSEWMEHLYMQQPMPKDATGVKVHLTAIDPNGNYQDIGYATADLNGNFGKMWTPPVPGEYHITATFEGSESYWLSDATTYFGVAEAPSAAQFMEPEFSEITTPSPTEPTAETPLITTEIAIIAAVAVAAVIGVVSFFALRKRK